MTTCTVPLGRSGQYQALVDAEDYAYITQWLWSYKISRGGKVYARRHRRVDGRRETVLMHNVILLERMKLPRPTPKHTGDHWNRASLDNTKRNLRWATAREQEQNKTWRRTKALTVRDRVDSLPPY